MERMIDNNIEDEANEREVRRIRQAQHRRLLNDIEQARVESAEQSVVEGLRAKGLMPSEPNNTPAAPERGEWRVEQRQTRAVIVDANGDAIAFGCGSRTSERLQRADQVVTEHNQHSTLITQRERLLRLLRPVTSPTACYCAVMKSEKCWHCEARELITAIEQDQIVNRTTTGREG